MNTKFADIVSNALVFAPNMITIDTRTITAPTADDYAKAGYWPVTETHPDPVSGKHEVEGTPEKIGTEHERTDYQPVPLTPEEEAENQRRMEESAQTGVEPELISHDPVPVTVHYTTYEIRRVWTLVDDPAPVTVYSVEEIIYGLIQRNALQAVKQIAGDYWELFTMRETISDDNEIWASQFPVLKEAIVASGALDEAGVAAVLAEAEVAA